MKKTGLLIYIFSVLFHLSCTPKVAEREYEDTSVNFDPVTQDAELDFNKIKNPWARNLKKINFSAELSTSTFFEIIENLFIMGKEGAGDFYTQLGQKMVDSFYANENTTSVLSIKNAPFPEAVVGENQSLVQNEIDDGLNLMKEQEPILLKYIDEFSSLLHLNKEDSGLNAKLSKFDKYLESIVAHMDESKGLSPTIYRPFKSRVITEKNKVFPIIQKGIVQIESAKKMIDIMKELQSILQQLNYGDLEYAQQLKLNNGLKIAQIIESAQSEQDILALLITIWQAIDPVQREIIFKNESESLYTYFNWLYESELDCLKRSDCRRPILYLVRRFKILPEIRKRGVFKLRDEIHQKALAATLEELRSTADKYYSKLPELIKQAVHQGFLTKAEHLNQFKNGFSGHIRSATEKFYGKKNIKIFEIPYIKIELLSEFQKIKIDETERNQDIVYSQAVGKSLQAFSLYLESLDLTSPDQVQKHASGIFDVINKLLMIGSYRLPNGELSSSLSLSRNSNAFLDLNTFSEVSQSFSLPDQFIMDRDNRKIETIVSENVSAQSQIAVFKGISHTIGLLKDWEPGKYDKSIGTVMLGDLLEGLDDEEFQQPLFPRTSLLPLAIANAGVLLKNIEKEFTNVFLIGTDNEFYWADQDYGQSKIIMAGIVDYTNGRRANEVKSKDIAQYIMALAEFYINTTGIEQTQSSVLLKMNSQGGRVLDVIIDARKKIKLLIVGLANFLSKKMTTYDGGVFSHYSINNKAIVKASRFLENQAEAIIALLKAYEVTGVGVYKSAAIDTYHFMNQALFRYDKGFYLRAEGLSSEPQYNETLKVIRSLMAVRPYLNQQSSEQLNKLLHFWL